MRIIHTSGEPYGQSGQEYSLAEAADVAQNARWAALQRGFDGHEYLVVGSYRYRTGIQDAAVPGREMARKLRTRDRTDA